MSRKEKKEQLEKFQRDTAVLSQEINRVQEEMAATLSNFSDTTDPELLEYYTYQYKASEIKHGYLMKKLKKIYYNNK